MLDKKNRLLAPLVLAAAVSVVAFAGIGVAAITGHLSVTQVSPNPFAGLLGMSREAPEATPAAVNARKQATRSTSDARPIDFRPGTKVAGNKKAKCTDCGVVDSIRAREIENASENNGAVVAAAAYSNGVETVGRASAPDYAALRSVETRIAVNFVVTLRMEDGSTRTIYENQRPPFSIGERVRLVNGSVVPLG